MGGWVFLYRLLRCPSQIKLSCCFGLSYKNASPSQTLDVIMLLLLSVSIAVYTSAASLFVIKNFHQVSSGWPWKYCLLLYKQSRQHQCKQDLVHTFPFLTLLNAMAQRTPLVNVLFIWWLNTKYSTPNVSQSLFLLFKIALGEKMARNGRKTAICWLQILVTKKTFKKISLDSIPSP